MESISPKGTIPPDHVAPDSLLDIRRMQTNPPRWQGETWADFVQEVESHGVRVRQAKGERVVFLSDAGGIAQGLPSGVIRPNSAEQVSHVLKGAQKFRVPVTTRGGGLTTEGESIAYGGVLMDMSSLSRVKHIDKDALTVRTEAGIFWHHLAEELRRESMDYLSAPLNLTASVGGTLGVGGIDINSPRLGCSADQAESLLVVTPTGEIVECNEQQNPQLFERVLLGYGQFGVIVEATMKIRPYTPLIMRYFYYGSLEEAIEDMMWLTEEDAADYVGILTMLDRAINLLVAFDSEKRRDEFAKRYQKKLKGHGEFIFGLKMAGYYALRPWKLKEAFYILERRLKMFPDFNRPEHMKNGRMVDRTVVFSRAVWKYWGGKQMVIPDLSAKKEKFVEAVKRGNEVCRKYFPYYTLYCVGIKLKGDLDRYEMSCMPPDAKGWGYGCEFEPMLNNQSYSRDYLQSFKNDIYDIGVDMSLSYYRFGGVMKGYIRRTLGDEVVDKHLALKRKADPNMILNPEVVF